MASTDDVLTAIKNIVVALNNTNKIALAGYAVYSTPGIATNTLLVARPARIHVITVTTAGTTAGAIYDASSITTIGAANLIVTIPATVGIIDLNWPTTNGIVYVPGSGQIASISYT